MEIQKIFSDEYNEERYYSVLMNEEELMMFSEIQKEFGKKDYLGLDKESVDLLKEKRSKIAKNLNERRNEINKRLLGDPEFANLERDIALHESGILSRNARQKAETLTKANAQKSELSKAKEAGERFRNIINNSKERIEKLGEQLEEQEKRDLAALRKFKSEESIARHAKKAKKLRLKRDLKRGGAIALGVAGAAGLAYGAKKLHDKKKKEKE